MNQQMFATIFMTAMGTYFAALLLLYVLRTSLAWFFSQTSSAPELQPTFSGETEVETWTHLYLENKYLSEKRLLGTPI